MPGVPVQSGTSSPFLNTSSVVSSCPAGTSDASSTKTIINGMSGVDAGADMPTWRPRNRKPAGTGMNMGDWKMLTIPPTGVVTAVVTGSPGVGPVPAVSVLSVPVAVSIALTIFALAWSRMPSWTSVSFTATPFTRTEGRLLPAGGVIRRALEPGKTTATKSPFASVVAVRGWVPVDVAVSTSKNSLATLAPSTAAPDGSTMVTASWRPGGSASTSLALAVTSTVPFGMSEEILRQVGHDREHGRVLQVSFVDAGRHRDGEVSRRAGHGARDEHAREQLDRDIGDTSPVRGRHLAAVDGVGDREVVDGVARHDDARRRGAETTPGSRG